MTALSDTVALILTRQGPVVATFGMTAEMLEELAAEALGLMELDADGDALDGSDLPSMRLALDVVVWRAAENAAALGFDFSADGGSYQRSQLAEQASKMRVRAEDRAAAAGLAGFGSPPVVYAVPEARCD